MSILLPRRPWSLLGTALTLLLLAGRAQAALLADSTQSDGWRLGNGLEVRVRHIPRATGVAITVAYRAGSLHEPAGREGLADLLAEGLRFWECIP